MNQVRVDNYDWDREREGGFKSIRRNRVRETLDEIYARQRKAKLVGAKIDAIIQSEYGGAAPEVKHALLRTREKLKDLIND